jgi:ribonuclease III
MVEPQIVILVVAGSSPVDHPIFWGTCGMKRCIDLNHRNLEIAETITGYVFQNRALLAEALTHSSMKFELDSGEPDNQRLEFLGDAVVQVLIAGRIFHSSSTMDEGDMTKLRANIVSTRGLALVARRWELGQCLFMTRSEDESGGRGRDAALADMVESIMGAIYLDGGFAAASTVAEKLFTDSFNHYSEQVLVDDGNPKGQLQEITQLVNAGFPSYEIVSDVGPDHDKHFAAVAILEGKPISRGTGRTKREAEAEAARAAITDPEFMKTIEFRRRIIEAEKAANPQPKKKKIFYGLKGTPRSERH